MYSFEMDGLYDVGAILEGGGGAKKINVPCSGVSFYNVQCICVTKMPLYLPRLPITKAPHMCSAFRYPYLIYNTFVLLKYP